jgi:hypothetical protein
VCNGSWRHLVACASSQPGPLLWLHACRQKASIMIKFLTDCPWFNCIWIVSTASRCTLELGILWSPLNSAAGCQYAAENVLVNGT